jgi:hypothetical protein
MNTRTIGVVVLICGAVIAAQVAAGLLFMGGALIHEAAQPQGGMQVAFGNGPLINNFAFDGVFGDPRQQACTHEELQAARGPVQPAKECTISGPYTHENLTLFLIHGPDKMQGQQVMPLQGALDQNLAVVHEGALSVDNRANMPLFIQAGDIVKGGNQDRVLPYDYLIPVGKSQLPVTVFCVESGRSMPRGQEVSTSFQTSTEQLPGKRLQMAARYMHAQNAVWQGVAQLQRDLERNLGGSVQSPLSASSLQLTLESDRVQQAVAAYVNDIGPRTVDEADAIGVAVVVNGEIQSVDTYGSAGLFRELFPKVLKAGAVAAVAERKAGEPAALPSIDSLQKFMISSEKGNNCQRIQTDGTLVLRQETDRAVLFETCDPARQNAVLHRSYLAK